jgi:hypothetical protein
MECSENLEKNAVMCIGKKNEIQEEKKCKGTSVIIHLKKQIQVHVYNRLGFSNHWFDLSRTLKTFVCYYKARALSSLAGP